MRAACLRLGNLLNQAELARDTGLSPATTGRYLDLLETSCHLVRLQPYSVNRTKRLIKAPKLYWTDTGLACHLGGELEPRGAHLENLVLQDLLAWRGSELPAPEILYWRTVAGTEVDFVIERKGRLLPIEIKATRRPNLAAAKNLEAFLDDYPEAPAGLLLHDGEDVEWLTRRVLAAPWWAVI
jgi:uncharacterized protein